MTNLVPVTVTELPIPNRPESALLAAIRGELAEDDTVFDFDLGDLGDHNDLEGILPDVTMVKVDGGAGVFSEKDQDPRKAPSELYGVILARQGAKVFFPPRDNVLDYARGVGFHELITEDLKWICRCPNNARPTSAELNPALTQAQRDEAARLKLGGATGRGCVGCPANSWYDPGDGSSKIRLCKDSENLIWLDSEKDEPVVLTMVAASCVVSLHKYLKTCFSKGKPLPLFRHLVKLNMVEVKSDRPGVKDWYELQVTNLQPLDRATMNQLAGAFKANLHLLDRASKRVDSLDGHGFEQSAPDQAEPVGHDDDPFGGQL